MPVTEDSDLARMTQFGEYKGTFKSENGQIVVDFFKKGDTLAGYISTAKGVDYETVTDKWVKEVRRVALELGGGGRYQLYYTA